ncbi:sugar ABC transporter ATP-binding protein [Parasphaerochaeta coccoides]|uniref:Monosaccharide ABC transporter ATP-binding protein, CUT2 family n=1 Tax=Parasphaerochaeta coccoides (strain ATCC BAA-1237 / DSM 17374 / SPN1) TaxID=760011 RepID=F4GJ28_PARC1|nr:sugar ABC transporter ATP-binding protein [Parasphaerochaeta coccoides]AEC01323.1 monosaccharide ABC transporter ATP-binding protein, CUT2 family [Parasphaerochaeta coccoides DSM 17374]
MEDKNLLELRNITKRFTGVLALDSVSMHVRQGEVHGLVGENGAGKSTLIKVLAGAHSPDSGEIYFDGQVFPSLTPHQAMDLGIACIYQELNQVPHMTVTENIFLGRELKKNRLFLDRAEANRRATEILKEFELDIDSTTPLGLLGVGQCQMIEICRAVHAEAKLIIMDEPTASLSEKDAGELFRIIKALKEKQVTVIYISHRLEEVKNICDSLTVMRDGCVVANNRISDVTVDNIIHLMVGRDITHKYPKKEIAIGETALEVKGLTRKGVFEDISFSVNTGEILAFSGLVGAGRTEMVRGLTGTDPSDSGEVTVFGEKVRINSPADSIKAGIAFLTEDRKQQGLILIQSIEFNSTLVHLKNFKKNKFFLDLFGMKNHAGKIAKELRIKAPDTSTLAGQLSGGNQQKVVLAKWVMTQAKIFIFDEPTRGIDVGAKIEVYNLINSLLENGAAVIMISSEMDECMGMADRIIVMHEGRITGELQREEFDQGKIMYAASGISST